MSLFDSDPLTLFAKPLLVVGDGEILMGKAQCVR